VGRLPVRESDFTCAAVDVRLQKYVYENNKMESVRGEFRCHCRANFQSQDSLIFCLVGRFRRLLQSEFSTECDLVLSISISSKLSFP
jgi:hypothetical protein